MKIPHFYCVESNLGIINFPYGTKVDNSGVAFGHKAIITSDFLNNFPKTLVDKIQLNNNSNKQNYFESIIQQYNDVSNLIKGTLDPKNELPVAIGGDHSISLFAIGSILERENAKDISVIMFDSHADIHLQQTSPSGNFHGMWVRPIIDKFDIDVIDKKVPNKIPAKNWVYIGNLEEEPYFNDWELKFINDNKMGFISKQALTSGLTNAKNILKNFIDKAKKIYVTFDIDVYHKDVAPATGITGKWGLNNDAIPIFLKMITSSGKLIGADIVEVNPEKNGAEKTVQIAQSNLLQLIR